VAELFETAEPEAEPGAAVQTDNAAVAIALDRVRRRGRKAAAGEEEVDRFLEKQEGLIDDQRAHLREQMAHMRLKHFDQRLSVMLKLMTAAAAGAVLIAIAAMAWSASRDDSLVIEAFGAPADLTAQGITGTALATRLHDKLAQMQASTTNVFAAVAVRDTTESRVRVEIPETGISLGEVDQLFRQWLGHQARVSGEVSHVAAGPERGALELTLRVGEEPGVRIVQADGDLEPLLTKGAEYVYRTRAPLRFAGWLRQTGRSDEGVALLQDRSERGSAADRAEAMTQLAQMLSISVPVERRIDLQRRAYALSPGSSAAMNLAAIEVTGGLSEAAASQFDIAMKTPPPAGGTADAYRLWRPLGAFGRGLIVGDFQPVLSFGCAIYAAAPCGVEALVDAALANPAGAVSDLRPTTRIPRIAEGMASAHAVGAAARLAAGPWAAPADSSKLQADTFSAQWLAAQIEIARQREDWAEVLAHAEQYETAAAPYPGIPPGSNPRLTAALALAKLGRGPEALAKVGATPMTCYPCLVVRGQIAAALGDPAGAGKWFGEAARQGPSLPQADLEWGRMLLAAGQADAAIGRLQKAAKASPKFADPLEVWGEALLAKGDAAAAAGKFAAADKLTPWWGRLHLKWGQALAKLGRNDEARAQLRRAASLDLTPAERAELTALKL
jgi:tetratricopeptide (TPR) repeat protein